MIKKLLVLFGGVLTCVIIILIGLNVYTGRQAALYDDKAVPYIKAAIPEISKWDKDIFYSYLSSEAKKKIDQDNLVKIFEVFKKMGPLVSHEEPEFERSQPFGSVKGEEKTLVVYNVDATYENGDALLTFTLVDGNDTLKLQYFNLQSEALVK